MASAAIAEVMAATTHYAVLGVSPDASEAAFKRAFYQRMRLVHPDKTDDARASDATVRVNDSWAVLSDANERAEYAAVARGTGQPTQYGGGRGFSQADMEDFLFQMFYDANYGHAAYDGYYEEEECGKLRRQPGCWADTALSGPSFYPTVFRAIFHPLTRVRFGVCSVRVPTGPAWAWG